MALTLKTATLALGAALAALGFVGALRPRSAAEALRRFPRSRWPAWVLTALDLVWSAWLLFEMPMEQFEHLKPLLYVLTPLAFVLIVVFVDELLAARALGGLLALIPAPLLAAARWHPSPWRYVVVALSYAMAVAGMALILSPYHFRHTAQRLAGDEAACVRSGRALFAAGLVLAFLGAFVY